MPHALRRLLVVVLWTFASSVKAQSDALTIGLIGDSTVAETYGWGPAFTARVSPPHRVLNDAKNGASLDTLSKALDALLKREPEYVIVQFGHNDQERYDTEVYKGWLRSYVHRIVEADARAVIFSPVTRRQFGEDGQIALSSGPAEYPFFEKLDAYARAACAVAAELEVPFVDLYSLSVAHHNALGPEATRRYDFNPDDRTHFSPEGAQATVELMAKALDDTVPELTQGMAGTAALE